MTKRQLIDEIVTMNRSAEPAFLSKFDDIDLEEYLQHLLLAQEPRMTGDPHQYDHYFEGCPAVSAQPVADSHHAGPLFDEEEIDLDVQASQADSLDLNVSPNAFFKESYEAKAS